MSFLCPSCCLSFFSSSEPQNPNQPQVAQTLDQQQKVTLTIKTQAKTLPMQYFNDSNNSQIQEMNVNLDLDQGQDLLDVDQRRHVQLLEDEEQSDVMQEDQVQPTEQELKIAYNSFTINLDPYDKYYKLLHEKTDNLQQYFTIQGIPLDIGLTKSNLTIKKHLTESQSQSLSFQLSYILPCSYSYYKTQCKQSISPSKRHLYLFQHIQILQTYKPNFTLNQTRLKRYNVLQPREFIYLKYSNGSYRQNWQVCFMEEQKDRHSQNYKQCELFSVSNFKEINNKLYVRQFLTLDLKTTNMNTHVWSKIIHQVKQYFENLYVYVQNNYQKQLL